MRFTWDSEKAAQNIRKHDVDFDTALLVFSDPNNVDIPDDEHSEDEDRWKIIGLADMRLLCVIYVEKDGDTFRLISARKASKNEHRLYRRESF